MNTGRTLPKPLPPTTVSKFRTDSILPSSHPPLKGPVLNELDLTGEFEEIEKLLQSVTSELSPLKYWVNLHAPMYIIHIRTYELCNDCIVSAVTDTRCCYDNCIVGGREVPLNWEKWRHVRDNSVFGGFVVFSHLSHCVRFGHVRQSGEQEGAEFSHTWISKPSYCVHTSSD